MGQLCYNARMATITLEVPDSLAEQLAEMGDRLPEVLTNLLESERLGLPPDVFVANSAWGGIIEFLSARPDDRSILEYKLSNTVQDRIEELLYSGSAGIQTAEERVELEGYIQAIQFFDLLKARLRAKQV